MAYWSSKSSLPETSDNPAPDLYVSNVGRGDIKRVETGEWGTTGNNERFSDPRFTPDSGRVLFQANEVHHYAYDLTTGSVALIASGFPCSSGLWIGPHSGTWLVQRSPTEFSLLEDASGNSLREYDLELASDPPFSSYELVGEGPNSRYVFLAVASNSWRGALRRLDLETGAVATLLGGRESPSGLSANGRWVAALSLKSKTVRIWNTVSGEMERTVSVRLPRAIEANWGVHFGYLSSDGTSWLVRGTLDDDSGDFAEVPVIIRINTVTGDVRVVARHAGQGMPLLTGQGLVYYHDWSSQPSLSAA